MSLYDALRRLRDARKNGDHSERGRANRELTDVAREPIHEYIHKRFAKHGRGNRDADDLEQAVWLDLMKANLDKVRALDEPDPAIGDKRAWEWLWVTVRNRIRAGAHPEAALSKTDHEREPPDLLRGGPLTSDHHEVGQRKEADNANRALDMAGEQAHKERRRGTQLDQQLEAARRRAGGDSYEEITRALGLPEDDPTRLKNRVDQWAKRGRRAYATGATRALEEGAADGDPDLARALRAIAENWGAPRSTRQRRTP